MSNEKYQADGVNVEAGDDFSAFCGKLCRKSYGNSPFLKVTDMSNGNFRGPRGFSLQNLPDGCIMAMTTDGIGTKVIPIVASGNLVTAAHDLVAMGAMDITRWGGVPIGLNNILDVASLGEPGSDSFQLCVDVMNGLDKLITEHGYVMVSGEVAEVGPCVGSEDPNAKLKFNWGSTMFGVYHPKKMIRGETLAPGQVIMALREQGFRSNGLSMVRKALALRYGDKWYENPEALPDIIAAATPSVQYDRFLNRLHGWYNVGFSQLTPVIKMHLIVHLSGGAFKSKLGEDILVPRGLSAEFTDLFDPPPIMHKCAEWRGLSDDECYSSINGGQGALVVIDNKDVGFFVDAAREHNIEAKPSGIIVDGQEFTIRIASKFSSKTFTF